MTMFCGSVSDEFENVLVCFSHRFDEEGGASKAQSEVSCSQVCVKGMFVVGMRSLIYFLCLLKDNQLQTQFEI